MKNLIKITLSGLLLSQLAISTLYANENSNQTKQLVQTSAQTKYKTIKIDGLDIFYREAGSKDKPTLLLLHGFPTSSHMFRDLIPKLSDKYHVIAPDYPGYGNSSMPNLNEFNYTFDNMAIVVEKFLEKLSISKYSMYVMDYGAPIGFRIASKNPDNIQSLIIQNGNAYNEGLNNNFWEPIKEYWKDKNAINKGLDNDWWKNIKKAYNKPEMTNDEALRFLLTQGATKWQYTNGVKDLSKISPDTWNEDQRLLNREGNNEIQLQMFYDYRSNPPLYAKWQKYFRKHQPATLIVWGNNDEIFPTAGAHPYKKDLKNIEFHLFDTGHFALEEYNFEIANHIENFLDKNVLNKQ